MRTEKLSVIEEVQKWVRESPYLIVADYTGLRVDQFTELRNRLSKVEAEMHVVKNTFLRRALSNESLPELDSDIKGQTAIVYGKADISAAAKVLKTFQKEFERPKVRIGILDRSVLSAENVVAIADLPSKDALRAQLLGLIATPATRLARVIQTPASQLAQVLLAKAEKGE